MAATTDPKAVIKQRAASFGRCAHLVRGLAIGSIFLINPSCTRISDTKSDTPIIIRIRGAKLKVSLNDESNISVIVIKVPSF